MESQQEYVSFEEANRTADTHTSPTPMQVQDGSPGGVQGQRPARRRHSSFSSSSAPGVTAYRFS